MRAPSFRQARINVVNAKDARLVVCHGTDVFAVFTRAGNRTPQWIARHGDDGVRVAGRYGVETAEQLARTAGRDAFPVVMEMGRPAVAILARDPKMLPALQAAIRHGHQETVLQLLARHGDDFLTFLGKHWKILGVGTACYAFSQNPEVFIEGGGKAVAAVVGVLFGKAADAVQESFLARPFVTMLGGLVMALALYILLVPKRYWPALFRFRPTKKAELPG